MGHPIRILIVEKQQFVADALQALLSQQPGMVVVGNIGSVPDPLPRAPESSPDVVILDFHLNDELAASAARTISRAHTRAKVIFLTHDVCDNVILAAIDAGASAVLHMSTAATDVIDAVRDVADGRTLIHPQTIATLLQQRREADGVRDSLTAREREILRLMAEGNSNREIATKLGIGYVTVRSHVRNLGSKLSAHSKLEIVAKAHLNDLVDSQFAPNLAFA